MDSGFEVFLYAGFVFFLSGEGEGGEKGKDIEMKDPTVSLILCWGNGWMSRSFLLVWCGLCFEEIPMWIGKRWYLERFVCTRH